MTQHQNRVRDQFQPNNSSTSNIYWKDEFVEDGVDLARLRHGEFQMTVMPGQRVDLDAVEHLKIGDTVQGEIEKPSGERVAVSGTILSFVAMSRNDQTFFFTAELMLSSEVSYESSLSRKLFLPIDKLTVAETNQSD